MAYKMIVVFALSLTVAMATAGGLGDLCFDACTRTETQQQECLNGCGRPVEWTQCGEECAKIGAPCRLLCFETFDSCKQQCRPAEPDNYNCLVACARDRYDQSLTTPAK